MNNIDNFHSIKNKIHNKQDIFKFNEDIQISEREKKRYYITLILRYIKSIFKSKCLELNPCPRTKLVCYTKCMNLIR